MKRRHAAAAVPWSLSDSAVAGACCRILDRVNSRRRGHHSSKEARLNLPPLTSTVLVSTAHRRNDAAALGDEQSLLPLACHRQRSHDCCVPRNPGTRLTKGTKPDGNSHFHAQTPCENTICSSTHAELSPKTSPATAASKPSSRLLSVSPAAADWFPGNPPAPCPLLPPACATRARRSAIRPSRVGGGPAPCGGCAPPPAAALPPPAR